MAQYKFHAFRRIRKCLTLDQAILLGNTFINNQFNYAVLIRMFCRKTMYHKIEKLSWHSKSNLPKLLESSSVSVYQGHLGFLVTEIYKSTTQINPEFMWSYFTQSYITYKPVHLCRFENFTICLGSYKNNTPKISHS